MNITYQILAGLGIVVGIVGLLFLLSYGAIKAIVYFTVPKPSSSATVSAPLLSDEESESKPVFFGIESFVTGVVILLALDVLTCFLLLLLVENPVILLVSMIVVIIISIVIGWMQTTSTPVGVQYAVEGLNGIKKRWNTKSGALTMLPLLYRPFDEFPVPSTTRQIHLELFANAKGTVEPKNGIDSIVRLKLTGIADVRTIDASEVIMMEGITIEEKMARINKQINTELETLTRPAIGSEKYPTLIKPDNHQKRADVTDVVNTGIREHLHGYDENDMVWAKFGQLFESVNIEQIELADPDMMNELAKIEKEAVQRLSEEMNNASRLGQAKEWMDKLGIKDPNQAVQIVQRMAKEITTDQKILSLQIDNIAEVTDFAKNLAQAAGNSGLGEEAMRTLALKITEEVIKGMNK